MYISIIIPAYNEKKNVTLLYERITQVLQPLKKTYEIIFIDDGSRDGTFQELQGLHKQDKKVRVIRFRKNFGQTAAMDAGFKHAKGEIIVSMDADLQNDPRDIPRLIEKIQQGFDVVCGWRKHRKDPLLKHVISRGANLLRKILINDNIHDSGCSLKAYRKECFEDFDLYGEMHRFIPALLRWKGFRITEIVVRHHARKFGKTKYTIKRVFKGFLDMIIVKFWMQYSTRPIHVFGALGIGFSSLGLLSGLLSLYLKIWHSQDLTDTFLPFLAIMLVVMGIQFLVTGVLADILIKNHYKHNKYYQIKEII